VSDIATTDWQSQIAQPLTTYRREPLVQDLLESWTRIAPRVVLQRLVSGAPDVPNEALVAAARALSRAGNENDAWKVVEVLGRRVAGRIYRHLAAWGFGGSQTAHQEDITRDILQMMMESVLSTAPRNEFWECRFWTCFDRRARTILRDFRARNRNDSEWNETIESAAAGDQPLSKSYAKAVDWTDDIAARTLLDRLPEPLRTAFYLKHYAGYKEESEDEPTIASTLRVSGRTVRNYLRRAEQLLSEWRADNTGEGAA
jgi:DNA-directed RNA polymerase specialized sigma24 family protein